VAGGPSRPQAASDAPIDVTAVVNRVLASEKGDG